MKSYDDELFGISCYMYQYAYEFEWNRAYVMIL
jgi:hypothetical protein